MDYASALPWPVSALPRRFRKNGFDALIQTWLSLIQTWLSLIQA